MRRLSIISTPIAVLLSLLSAAVTAFWIWHRVLWSARVQRLLRERRYEAIFTLGPHRSKIIKSTIREELESPFSDTFEQISLETRQISKNLELKLNKKDFWQVYDVVSDIYRKGGGARLYKSKQAFYTVFEARLQRTTPHLVFDAKLAKGKQFKRIYLNAQHLSLDGNFDDYFDSYSPQGYEIDTLSFITPEVIVAMIEMPDCDIEFIEDSLLCYGSLLEKSDLEEFVRKCLNLYASVNDNLDTYKDNRLVKNKRAHEVSVIGKRLLRDPLRHVPMLIFSGTAIIIIIALSVYAVIADFQIALNFYAILIPPGSAFLYHLAQVIDTFKHNNDLMERSLFSQPPIS